jgi:hypothetical protein
MLGAKVALLDISFSINEYETGLLHIEINGVTRSAYSSA